MPQPRSSLAPKLGRPRATIRIVIADAQHLDRAAWVTLFRQHAEFEVVAECGSCAETLAACRARRPDVLLLSLGLRGPTGLPIVRDVRVAFPELPVVALSERGREQCLMLSPPRVVGLPILTETPRCERDMDCLALAEREGAQGTLRRSASPEQLFQTLRRVAAGGRAHDGVSEARAAGGIPAPAGPRLSRREREVALLLAHGRSNKEIASALRVGEPTVKKHVSHVLAKLGVQDRLQAGLFVVRHPLTFSFADAD